jgi:hypothetical protein
LLKRADGLKHELQKNKLRDRKLMKNINFFLVALQTNEQDPEQEVRDETENHYHVGHLAPSSSQSSCLPFTRHIADTLLQSVSHH